MSNTSQETSFKRNPQIKFFFDQKELEQKMNNAQTLDELVDSVFATVDL